MRSVNDIVNVLNKSFKIPGQTQLFGVAATVLRDNARFPVTMDKDGEGKYVGIDNDYSVILYHKINTAQHSIKPNSAYGNSRGDNVTAFAMSMIVFLNRKKYHVSSDELMQIIRAMAPDKISSTDYTSISVTFNNAILNDLQVYTQEYGNSEFRLLPEHNLFQLNYTLEMVFRKGCFNTCPEDKN